MTMYNQIKHTNKDIEIIKRNHPEPLEWKNTKN